MPFKSLSSRAIIGDFYLALEQELGESWVGAITNLFTSDQESETYRWLGQVPQMRQWIGGRLAKGLRDQGITLENLLYESTLEIPVDWMRRDKTSQIALRIREQALRANSHWASLLSTLLIAGEAAVCYDGQYFFDDDHSEGDSGTQDNDLTSTVTSATAPTVAEAQASILQATQAMLGFVDDQGQPMNSHLREFLVMVPVSFLGSFAGALGASVIATTDSTIQALGSVGGIRYQLAANPYLSSWTTKWALFGLGGGAAPLIRQEELGVQMDAVAEGSELEFNDRVHRYGISASRAVGYGMWQRAVLTTLST